MAAENVGRYGDKGGESGGGLTARSNRMVNTSLARYCTPVTKRWSGEIAGYYFIPPLRQLLRNGLHFEFQITLCDC
ncbi:hypothetical protein ALC53_11927 [Atta colombica]|uniref:Uncharacterized protein n=1 Tax=Atta colombica TaxID=520822 RepID=A0A195AZF7_9HYME|nr:hypothetical protein ALC53_11927 [Atta colombica]